jgi:hypothetical protein
MGYRRRMSRTEVIVVMGCVVLAVLTVGAAGESARRLARELVCLGNTGVLAEAWLAYANENDGALVGGHTNPGQWVDRAPQGLLRQELDAIRRGLLFPYVEDLNAYHCPADQSLNDPNQTRLRSYAIAAGANGQDWSGYSKATVYADLENPATRYIFVEEFDPRGGSIGSWQMNPGAKTWVDPLAMWHEEATTLGFADGHGEVHRWHDESFIDWCDRAMDPSRAFSFNMTPPADEQRDVEYMAAGFPYKALR